MAGNSRPRNGALRAISALGLAFTIAVAAALAASPAPAVKTARRRRSSARCGPNRVRRRPRQSASPAVHPAPLRAAIPRHSRPPARASSCSATACPQDLGLSPQEAFPALLQRKIDAEGLKFEVINAGVSGDTSAGGLRRLDWALDGDVQVLIVGLGANDGLRGLPVDEMRRNLSTIIERAQARHITVVLCGMEAPPNFGASYTRSVPGRVQGRRGEVSTSRSCRSCSMAWPGCAELNQEDGIHPNARGAQKGGRHGVEHAAGRSSPHRHHRPHDRAAPGVADRPQRRPRADHPAPHRSHGLRGPALAIVGPSGSGKSTLLGLMAGLDAPSTGTHHHRRRRHHHARPKTASRACAARKSASSSSSST